jgi:hypothetical protein
MKNGAITLPKPIKIAEGIGMTPAVDRSTKKSRGSGSRKAEGRKKH